MPQRVHGHLHARTGPTQQRHFLDAKLFAQFLQVRNLPIQRHRIQAAGTRRAAIARIVENHAPVLRQRRQQVRRQVQHHGRDQDLRAAALLKVAEFDSVRGEDSAVPRARRWPRYVVKKIRSRKFLPVMVRIECENGQSRSHTQDQQFSKSANAMSELIDCLQTHTPKVIGFPANLIHPPDPVPWALEMFAANLPQADMQSMEPGSGKQDSKVAYFDQKDPATFERFRLRIQNAQPVHGSLALIDYCAGAGAVRDNADWAWQVYKEQFAQGLAQCHPMGSYLRSTLWMSCGEHLYQAHCDLADGFLFQMGGHKRVRVWPVPQKYRRKVIFNYSDFEGRMASEPFDFELKTGEILFIPSGAMHEVTAHGKQAAVSVSFHMGSPFPLLTLCAQLNRMVQGGEVSVPPHMKRTDKFNMYLFEPSRFIEKASGSDDGMPAELLKQLAGVLQSKQVDSKTMRRLLANWWRLAMSRPMYQGPYVK